MCTYGVSWYIIGENLKLMMWRIEVKSYSFLLNLLNPSFQLIIPVSNIPNLYLIFLNLPILTLNMQFQLLLKTDVLSNICFQFLYYMFILILDFI